TCRGAPGTRTGGRHCGWWRRGWCSCRPSLILLDGQVPAGRSEVTRRCRRSGVVEGVQRVLQVADGLDHRLVGGAERRVAVTVLVELALDDLRLVEDVGEVIGECVHRWSFRRFDSANR